MSLVPETAEVIIPFTGPEMVAISGAVMRAVRAKGGNGSRVTLDQVRAVLEESWPLLVGLALSEHPRHETGDGTILCEWCGTLWPCHTAEALGAVT